MDAATFIAETFLRIAALAVQQGGDTRAQVLDTLPVPTYATNVDGLITYYNRACISFAGRTPRVGGDSWCVTWKLYTEDGHFLPHDQCPMAIALREMHPVRGVEAIAERPDGTRVKFIPHPTPWFDDDGNLVGAVNLVIDVTRLRQTQALWEQAIRCRRLARAITDQQAIDTLKLMAAEYEGKARSIEHEH